MGSINGAGLEALLELEGGFAASQGLGVGSE